MDSNEYNMYYQISQVICSLIGLFVREAESVLLVFLQGFIYLFIFFLCAKGSKASKHGEHENVGRTLRMFDQCF